MELLSIIVTVIISFGTFIASLFGLHYFWLKPHNSEIPIESKEKQPTSLRKLSINDEKTKKIQNLSQLLRVYLPLIRNLDTDYWIHNVGLDAYTYLYFQKELIKMLIVFGIVFCLIMIPVSIWSQNAEQNQSEDFQLETHNDNKRFYQEIRSIVDCLLLCFFSLYSIYTIFKIKDHIKTELLKEKKKRSAEHYYERLRDRSVHVRGVFPEDRKGEFLCSEIASLLEMGGINGRVVSCIIVPDFVRIVNLENDRKRIDNAQKLILANEPAVRRMFFPRKFRQQDYFERKLRSIDDKIEAEIMKPMIGSGHAFVCFNTYEARNHCLEFFSENPRQVLGACWSLVSNQDELSRQNRSLFRRKVTSTFQKFNDDLNLKDKDLKIFMNPIESPQDIFWANMGGTRGFFFFRRLIINTVAFFILVFLSTPASLLTALQKIEILKFIDVSQYVKDDSEFGAFLKQTIPPLLIILLNQLLLYLIDYAAYMEKHRSFTGCQISIFYKSLFYLTLNMLIIPALTLATADSLFKVLIYEGHSVARMLKQFYFSNPGSFFINILLTNGAFSSSFHMLRIGDILTAFGSTWLAHYQRTYMNDTEKWRKKESDVFQYGYLYAQVVSAYVITASYLVSTPIILLAGLSFLLMRYSVDGFNLLTFFKKEIDSEGQLIEPILKYAACSCLLLQLTLSISFAYSGYAISCTITSLLFLVTVYLVYRISSPILSEADRENNDMSVELKEARNYLNDWEAAYRHPLLVSPSEVVVQRETRALSYILQ